MPRRKDENSEENLTVVNHKIAEIKKKIQLSEGQRKAHFEECDAEKKRNIERIRLLKKEVKEIYKKLAEPNTCDSIVLKTGSGYSKDAGAIKNKKLDDAIVFMDLKCIDLNKKLDVLKYKNKSKKLRLKKLAEDYRDFLSSAYDAEDKKIEIVSNRPMCVLENQIHRVEMNMMEAEHINKKYKMIRCHLLSDSVQFESCLQKLEAEIKKQNSEIRNLQVVNKEALGLRDVTKGTLLRHEISAINAGKSRDNQLQEFRHRVEERKLELEKLERRIFPTGRMMFEDGTDSGDGFQTENTNQIVNQLEAAFAKLKAATGETEIEDVLPRFISQKDTKQRLEFLKRITEEEKKQLESKKETSLAQLEATKFSEVKDNEQSQDELEKLRNKIKEERSQMENNIKELEEIKVRILKIQSCFYGAIRKLQDLNNEVAPEPSDDVNNPIDVMNCLIRKVQSGLDEMNLGNNLQDAINKFQETQNQPIFNAFATLTVEDVPLFPALIQQNEIKQQKVGQPSLLTPDTDDEEDIPSRMYLKRQAQLIVDAKSRKKYNRVLNFPKSKK